MMMKWFVLIIAGFVFAFNSPVAAQQKSAVKSSKVFTINKPDYKLSPYTGMTRKHWKDAALYLLSGAFSYVNRLEDPMKFPKQPGKSYPLTEAKVPTEKLEGLCRTLFIAAPLLREEPGLIINKIKVADYYRYHISKLLDSTGKTFIRPRGKNGGPSQNLVEFGGLAVSLFAAPEILWNPLPQPTKDSLAALMLSYGDGPTIQSNWKFFNIFILSFFKDKGYKVNDKLLEEYLDKTLGHYKGNGWYNDNPAYDYYSMWAFEMYGTLWSEFFGKKYYPVHAAKFLGHFKEVKNNYPYMFARDGKMIMWGRSISYRFGAVIPFPLMGLVNDTAANLGWMRRIASGAMLQFLQSKDFLKDNIPTLGFYGAFEPAIQGYSCRGSAYWMGKAFLGLLVPANNRFWTSTENEGAWHQQMKKGNVYSKFLDTSKILITDYPNIGAAEIRAWCHVTSIGANEPFRSSENYNRLSYNSAFPWQADSSNIVAMNYVFKNKSNAWEPLRLFTFRKFEEGIYYREAVLETNKNIHLSLAELPLANGILRIDKNTSTDTVDLRLGHYALPNIKGFIHKEKRLVKGHEVQIISNGDYQLAMVAYKGWDAMETIMAKGLHPVSDESAVINVADNFIPQGNDNKVYATLMLWKKAGEKWTDDELVPVKNIKDKGNDIIVTLVNGTTKSFRFN